MTSYGKYIDSEEYLAAVKCRTKVINDVERYIRRVKSLASEEPDAFVFADLRSETKEAIKELDAKQNACLDLIAHNCDDYTDDEKYISDLDAYDAVVMAWLKILSAEAARVQGSTPVKEDKNDMTQVILEQLKAQGERMETQSDLIKSSIQVSIDKSNKSGPKPPTPTAPSF